MDIARAKEIVSALADGIDPFTGEILPRDHICNHPDMIRALYLFQRPYDLESVFWKYRAAPTPRFLHEK